MVGGEETRFRSIIRIVLLGLLWKLRVAFNEEIFENTRLFLLCVGKVMRRLLHRRWIGLAKWQPYLTNWRFESHQCPLNNIHIYKKRTFLWGVCFQTTSSF